MLIYDNHVHMNELAADGDDFIRRLEDGGIYGANVFSVPPKMYIFTKEQADYKERLRSVLDVTNGHRDRLFPFLFVHPDEDDIISKIEDAAEHGIMGYKMICSDYYVYEDKSMRMLEKIASLNKPVVFHSGILFDGKVSSSYNRPTNWECCLDVPNLRFALSHCSWPWIDECIAVYGKFRSARIVHKQRVTSEMFIDITPGTPKIYRKELLTKLHFIGYGLETNILFGSDQRVQTYNSAASAGILKNDSDISDELGIDADKREMICGKNLLRFVGIKE